MGSQWQVEKKKDPYYKRAKGENYRSRASYKLIQLNKKYKLIKKGNKVVDLGAAPGGWSQVAMERVENDGMVVGVDLRKVKPFPQENYFFIRGDFTNVNVQLQIMEKLNGKANTILSDASPSLSGIKNVDHIRSIELANFVIKTSEKILVKNGNLLFKVFQGEEYKTLLDNLRKKFKVFKTTKPSSSRKKSSEMYVIGLKYRKSS